MLRMVVDMCILSSTISYGVRNIGSESWLLENLQAKILAMEVMSDHIHLLLDCKPQFRPSDAIKVFKGNTAR